MSGVIGIYIFIVLGFLAKKQFKIDGKTLVILSTYYLQPFLTLWGIMLMPINKNLILAPIYYILIVFIALIFTYAFSLILKDKKDKIIATLTPLIGNTGNLGIPVSYFFWGDFGAMIATLINLANIFFIYSFGIFFFAKGEYSFKDAFKKIIKIPVMWFGILALVLNLKGIHFSADIMKILQMGAFASIVTQLLIFGVYIADIKVKTDDKALVIVTIINKFVVFTLVGFIFLTLLGVDKKYFWPILFEIATPLAISNVNLSALFNLYPEKVSFLVLITSILFLGIIFI